MGYVITGKSREGKLVRVYRKTKEEAKRHARAARAYGGKKVRIKRM